MTVSKIFNAINIIFKSRKPVFSFLKKGSSIASTQILHSLKYHTGDIYTVFDVGANQGQFAIASAYYFPMAKIYSFEPVRDTYKKLKANTGKYKNITQHNFALGNAGGMIEFFSNQYSHASSALAVSQLQKDILPKTSQQHVIKVPVKRLDDIVADFVFASPVLLKLDVQGFEKEVLKGAKDTLKKIDFLLFEASFVTMYDGEALFDEMHSFVKNEGFELIGPVGLLQASDLRILQMDMLYKRKK